MNLREEERQSLKNFEDFENTLLMLENNKNEDEFDDLLNSIGANTGKSQRVRQSLDIIKKRHSLINMEKQYHDELNREKSVNNKMNDSLTKSTMVSSTSSSASGSGERLLRRSRLYDDVISTSGNQLNNSNSSISSNDNRQATTTESDAATESLNRKNQSYLARDHEKTEQMAKYNVEEAPAANGETKPNNRDRFKTIRIFKKPPENAVQVLPDADANHQEATVCSAITSTNPFTSKNTNSPQPVTAQPKAINTMTFKKSALARPRYLGGIQKRDTYTKSSSHEILSNDDYDHEVHDAHTSKAPPLKSPMGVKSKSVHSLLTSNKMPTRTSAVASTSASNTVRTMPLNIQVTRSNCLSFFSFFQKTGNIQNSKTPDGAPTASSVIDSGR